MRHTHAEARDASLQAAMRSHFDLFDLKPAFAIDRAALEQSYRDLQSLVHPDRHAAAGDAQRGASLRMATDVNEAYRTLRDPVQRAKHLLELNGVDVAFETNTQMPTDFLMQQLEMREELEGAVGRKDFSLLDGLKAKLKIQSQNLQAAIGESIDARKDFPGAAEQVRKLMFLHRIEEEIDTAYEAIE